MNIETFITINGVLLQLLITFVISYSRNLEGGGGNSVSQFVMD